MKKRNIAIIGAAGRDYHNFLVKYKDNPLYDVKFFTAAQIPGIEKRTFPKKLAGKLYKKDIPLFPEEKLLTLIQKYKIDECVFAYSDLRHEEIMHKASLVNAAGASFTLLGTAETMIPSKKPVVAITAVRTGSGKSQVSRRVADLLQSMGKKIVAIRHPMPYGDLWKQRTQRFATYDDFDKHECTIEEREEYEPWIKRGMVIYAGVDYAEILKQAEKEADIIIWDGGNNDTPFYKPDLQIVVADPHRPGHEVNYHPGETNMRMGDIIIINKANTAKKEHIKTVMNNAKTVNKHAKIILADLKMLVSDKKALKKKKALIVEDGPTLTHGEMTYGGGFIAATKAGATIVKPETYAVRSIKATYNKYKHVHSVLPAMGYGEKQMRDLQDTINRAKADVVVDGTPVDLRKLLKINKPIVNVEYEFRERGNTLRHALKTIRKRR